jgi:hypothetical protein
MRKKLKSNKAHSNIQTLQAIGKLSTACDNIEYPIVQNKALNNTFLAPEKEDTFKI